MQSASSRAAGKGRSFLRIWRRDERGFTAVEFALVIGPFLALLFAIMEVALVYFATFSLENATEQAARLIRTGQAQGGNFDEARFKREVCARVPVFISCDSNLKVDVRSFDTFTEAASGVPQPFDARGNLLSNFEQYSPGKGGSVVLVSVYYHWGLMASLPRMGDFTGRVGVGVSNMPDGSRLISASTAFRNEPF